MNTIFVPELAHKATPPHSRPAVDPSATPQCKLFLGGKWSLRHLEQLFELNLKTAVTKGRLLWKYTRAKRDSFARKRRTHAAMLLFDVTLILTRERVGLDKSQVSSFFSDEKEDGGHGKNEKILLS